MSKISPLNDLANLSNEQSAVAALSDNNDKIESAFTNTLSRDGSTPNQMGANLDMNSNRIINLPTPQASTEPLRVQDALTPVQLTVVQTGDITLKPTIPSVDAAVDWLLIADVSNGNAASKVHPKDIGIRERLTADRTYYVATSGNDSNDGLTALTPFLTVMKALTLIRDTLDVAGFQIVIQVVDGAYTEKVLFAGSFVGVGSTNPVIIRGNVSTPGNVTWTITGTPGAHDGDCCVGIQGPCRVQVEGLTLSTVTNGQCLDSSRGATLYLGAGLVFGSSAGEHIRCHEGGTVRSMGPTLTTGHPYTITGGAQRHWQVSTNSAMTILAATITLTGTPNFSHAFAFATQISWLNVFNLTFSGAATGKRYDAQVAGVVNTDSGNVNALPGNVAGTTATNGLYT